MKKFKFVEPTKIKLDRYPDINSVYREEDDGHQDFFSFEDGVAVDDETTQNWVNECVKELIDNPEENYCFYQGGNTLVIATRSEEEINVWVSRSHINATIPLYEPKYFDYEETV